MSTSIKKPILATSATDEYIENMEFPVYATPKIDGIRALKIENMGIVSRSFKPIKNQGVAHILDTLLPNNSDGELYIQDSTFQDITSFVNTKQDHCNLHFVYYWFDYVKDDSTKGYIERINDMKVYLDNNKSGNDPSCTIIPLYPTKINSIKELYTYEQESLEKGFEGIMIRKPNGEYKFGRSTLNQGILLKLKRFVDDEATIVGFEELMHNKNEKKINELQLSSRSHKKNGMVPGNTLGSFIVEMMFNSTLQQFKVGSGFTSQQRSFFWNNRDNFKGKLVKFKYFDQGIKRVPRHPIFIGIRDINDL